MKRHLLFFPGVMLIMAACSSGTTSSSGCQNATECTGDLDTGCQWACVDGACKQLCTGDCQSADDCKNRQWPFDCEGHWECGQGTCNAVCDDTECSVAQDCVGEIQCPDAGHWICENGLCKQVCDGLPQCESAKDCARFQWEESCVGHWECEESNCQPVCDEDGCGNGFCEEENGETEDSCPDCDYSCAEMADCDHLGFPLNCVGHWECNNFTCTPVCDGADCSSDLDCTGNDWELKCNGNWDCVYGYCQGVCDAELCGDGFCDREEGESPASCPDDCTDMDCIGEGLRDGPLYDCCEGLDSLSDCFPLEICQPGSDYCVDCGNESCDPHENQYNCSEDCPNGCEEGEKVSYYCDNDRVIPWCECIPDQCPPICLDGGAGLPSGWVNSCTYVPYAQANCDKCHKECMEIGTDEEGWYSVCESSQGGPVSTELIIESACAPRWDCIANPERLCN